MNIHQALTVICRSVTFRYARALCGMQQKRATRGFPHIVRTVRIQIDGDLKTDLRTEENAP